MCFKYEVGEFVVATYSGNWYIGEIIDFDDDEFEVNVMEKSNINFRWPSREDQLCMTTDAFLCKVKKPVPSGKSERVFTNVEDDVQSVKSEVDGINT